MQTDTSIQLKHACQAVAIPAGNPVTLPAGTTVEITQTLGGTYTVRTDSGLFRIDAGDSAALGIETTEENRTNKPGTATAASGEELEKEIWDTLKTCFDPEIPVNIVDLGLVYDLHLEPTTPGWFAVELKMTLTAPGCGMGPVIARDAQQKILFLPGVESADVHIVWDPPWHQSMISADGRRILGLE